MRQTLLPVLCIIFAAMVALLQGCGDDGTPAPTHAPTEAPTPAAKTPAPTPPASPAEKACQELNQLFNEDADGVLYRSVKGVTRDDKPIAEPWKEDATVSHVSWSIFNKYAWDTEQQELSVYGCGKYIQDKVENKFVRPMVGVIAKNTAKAMLSCLYFCDGGTEKRVNGGCGCGEEAAKEWGWEGTCTDDNEDWCAADSFHMHGAGYPCALHPNEMNRTLQQYKLVKEGKGEAKMCANKWIGPATNAWTEADMPTEKWNADASNNVWAFFIPDQCEADTECKGWFKQIQKSWTDMNKDSSVPFLRLDRKDTHYPFKPYSESDTYVV